MSRYRNSMMDALKKVYTTESGHDDVKSAKNQVQIAMSALEKMNAELGKLNDEDSLPTWWTNKVAVAVDKLDGMADYLDTQVEEVELDEMKEPFAVVDTADGDKVVGTASSEKGAKEIISTAQLPPMKIKDKKTLKIVKTRKKQMIGHPLKEDVDLGKVVQWPSQPLDEAKEVLSRFKDDKLKQSVMNLAKQKGLKVKDMGDKIEVSGNGRKVMDLTLAVQKHDVKIEQLEENAFKELQIAAKDLAKYASKDKKGLDYKDFMKAAAMMKTGKVDQLVKHTNDLDTEPRDVIIMAVKDAIGKQAAERLFKVSIS